MRPSPPGFFERMDEEPDERFYGPPRLVTHIDDGAIAEVSGLYEELGVPDGEVLDLMSSWISHLPRPARRLVVLGMNESSSPTTTTRTRPWCGTSTPSRRCRSATASFDTVTCCVSVDYLVRPLEVFDEVARVLRPGGRFVCTFSNRCFPTKAIRGWLATDDSAHVEIVSQYFRRSRTVDAAGREQPAWEPPVIQHRNPEAAGDPLYAVWSTRRPDGALTRLRGVRGPGGAAMGYSRRCEDAAGTRRCDDTRGRRCDGGDRRGSAQSAGMSLTGTALAGSALLGLGGLTACGGGGDPPLAAPPPTATIVVDTAPPTTVPPPPTTAAAPPAPASGGPAPAAEAPPAAGAPLPAGGTVPGAAGAPGSTPALPAVPQPAPPPAPTTTTTAPPGRRALRRPAR